MMDTVQEIPQPVVAKVHALATAAGCQLVAHVRPRGRRRVGGFAIPGGKGGLFCHTPLVAVARNVGRKRALEMALTGDPIDAATAADWGLVNKVVPDADLDAAVLDLITRATRGSALSKAIGKRSFYAQVDLDQPKAYRYATEVMAAAALTSRRAGGDRGVPREAQAEVHRAALRPDRRRSGASGERERRSRWTTSARWLRTVREVTLLLRRRAPPPVSRPRGARRARRRSVAKPARRASSRSSRSSAAEQTDASGAGNVSRTVDRVGTNSPCAGAAFRNARYSISRSMFAARNRGR